MAVKVFFYTLRPYDEQGILEDLAKQRGIEYGYTEAYPTMENAQLAAGYDAVSLTPCDMSAPMLQRFHDLGVKAICCRSIGYDHVDLEKARELGMKVSNVDYPPNGVANFAIMLMLMSLRKAGHILKRGEVQDYSLKGKIGRDISNCTVGVIGTGRIGQTVLKHLSGFGCELLAYDLYQNDEVKKIAKYVPLETLLAESDVITLHTNATEENHHLLNAEAFAKMKPGVTIVNTARGKLIDSDALLAALESGQVGAAGLDVLENENGLYYYDRMGDVIPNPELAALRAMPNVILTDHTAFYTYEDVKSMVRGVLESAAAFAEGTVEEITDHVHQGISEVGIVYVAQKQVPTFQHILLHKKLEFIPQSEKSICVYVGPQHPLYHADSVDFSDLPNLKFMRGVRDFFSMEHHLETVSMGVIDQAL